MRYAFLKGHGTENDFVLLPDHDGSVHGDLPVERVRALCDRRAGIGGDGVLRVIRSLALTGGAGAPEWFMDYRNADGSVAEMCGNGIRVFAGHLYDEGLVPDGPVRIATRSGVKTVRREGGLLTAELGPATFHGETKVSVGDRSWPATHIVVGNPHAVVLLDDLAEAGSLRQPPEVDDQLFPHGVNVEFVSRRAPGHIAMRVHERGAGETRSCGTGACAAALASADGDGPGRWRVDVPGGTLEVSRDETGAVSLTGPAVLVARGDTDL
ncbi:MAG TPA: diaminopimelate epimerase [Nocardioides sp.]|uniref:diaminopimelate epimerase n=1 Tax=Nocardioides sp. TaxID=35761 RepID=UPI002E36CFD8|nr:diaminopimelate epimerase [Nocardioides sp.]HEX3932672.1 diaminopimelate epimerase [Nocardioides sp.]